MSFNVGGKHTFHRDVLDGKAENDGPNHTKSHLHITIHNFCQRSIQM